MLCRSDNQDLGLPKIRMCKNSSWTRSQYLRSFIFAIWWPIGFRVAWQNDKILGDINWLLPENFDRCDIFDCFMIVWLFCFVWLFYDCLIVLWLFDCFVSFFTCDVTYLVEVWPVRYNNETNSYFYLFLLLLQ